MVTVLIQAAGQSFQAATATPSVFSSVVSTTMEAAATGGLLQSLVPSHGIVNCSASTTMSSETTTFETSAFLLVASGIRYLNLSDAVALVFICF